MGRLISTAVAVLVLAGGAARGQDEWRQPVAPAGGELPPAAVPAPPTGGAPTWAPSRPDGPVWNSAGGAQVPAYPALQVQPPTAPAGPSEALPAPRPVGPGRSGIASQPPAAPAPASQPLPAPRAVPPPDVTLAPPRAYVADQGPVLEPPPVKPAGAAVPVRHGTFGSPNITLSREYHFLDLFGLDLVGDEANPVVVGEKPPADQSFVQFEYLLWWVNNGRIPPLATTAPFPANGFLGQPGTQTLIGPGSFGETMRNGFRVRAGTWFDAYPGCGVDGSFFFLGRQNKAVTLDSVLFPTIARPFFAPNFGTEFAQLVAFPGLSTGNLRVENSSTLWGADANVKTCLSRTCVGHAELFAGYRHLNLREGLTITETILADGPLSTQPAGTRVVVQDRFRTHNQFHGGQVGIAGGRQAGRWTLDGRASVALGVTHQEVRIDGFQTVAQPGAVPQSFAGGLLAAGPNLGTFTRNRFAVAPEATLNLGYMVTPNFKAYVGYNFLYWSNVVRPGDQIDRVVDVTRVPNFPTGAVGGGFNRPQPTFKSTDLVAQGLQFGIEFRW